MKLLYLVLSLLPTAVVVTLAWVVIRAISVRIVWRDADLAEPVSQRVAVAEAPAGLRRPARPPGSPGGSRSYPALPAG